MNPQRANQDGSWTGTTSASLPMIAFLVLVVVGSFVLIYLDAGWAAASGFTIVVTCLLVTFLYARVAIDRRGIEVRMGPLGWPKIFRSITSIKSGTPRNVEWWRYGLGYRLIPRGSAVVPRSGSAVEVRLKNGRRFIFTTEEPDAAVRQLDMFLGGQIGGPARPPD